MYMHYFLASMSQESGHACWVICSRCHVATVKGLSWSAFSSGSFLREELASKLIQVVDRTDFLVIIWLTSWLFLAGRCYWVREAKPSSPSSWLSLRAFQTSCLPLQGQQGNLSLLRAFSLMSGPLDINSLFINSNWYETLTTSAKYFYFYCEM